MSHKKTVLIVEDEALNREILSVILSDTYETIEAENGMDALEILRAHKDDISLILLDLFMPVMDGYSFLDVLVHDKELSLIPVVVTTQESTNGTEVDALKHGATDFVPKPYNRDVILNRVARLIKFRETAAFVNQMNTDRLTGLMSKDYFCVKADEMITQNPDKEYVVVCTDFEDFNLYNDLFGYEEGNRLLVKLAERIRENTEGRGICGRLQADKFVCLVESDYERSSREKYVELLSKDQIFTFKNVRMKWGIYEVDSDTDISVEKMCDRAQLAVQSIKGIYGKYYHVYDDALREALVKEKRITDAMMGALSDEQFVVYLQPKYNLTDNSMNGAEALVRWKHPEWGMIPPGEFIPVFEKNGFIFNLDCYVWEKTCQIISGWIRNGKPVVPVSVNVSRADLYRKNLVTVLSGLVEKYDIPYYLLHLEITESAYASNPYQIMTSVEELRALGFIIEMDDFGSGYSSLNMLGEMKLDIMKLDIAFVRNETAKSLNSSILSNIVTMAHKLHLSVTAEGVETINQLQRLKSIGCDTAQGYFFSKPVPVEEFEVLALNDARLRDNRPSFPEPHNRFEGLSVLVVDEDADYYSKMTDAFSGSNRVIHAEDTESAIDIINSQLSDGCVDIAAVVVSNTLRDNGAEKVVRYIRQTQAIMDLPIILAFSNSGQVTEAAFLDQVNDILCKSHPTHDVMKHIKLMVNLCSYREHISLLKKVAYHDYMTGILNRRGLDDEIIKLKPTDMPIAVCLFDMDNLKEINDFLGHARGDWAIKGFADIMKNVLGEDNIFCRFGGDEIIAVIRNCGDREAISEKLGKVLHDYTEMFEKNNLAIDDLLISCSGGAAIWETRGDSYGEVFDRADKALYKAKLTGKNKFYIWDDDM